MDIVAWTIRAVPFLQDRSISELLNIFRATEIPLEPSLLQAYHHAQTSSQAVLSVVEQLYGASLSIQLDEFSLSPLVGWAIQAVEMLVVNNQQAQLALSKTKLVESLYRYMVFYLALK